MELEKKKRNKQEEIERKGRIEGIKKNVKRQTGRNGKEWEKWNKEKE